ncbi:copper resistance CopC family protein [Bhargavaea ullalensis]|uniref:Methionine-rich copper-binding protein CopC n=1 Tax=Bhargavaea ullalensis TaxID=1265685 RepID=A0ABV2GB60_9BACL
MKKWILAIILVFAAPAAAMAHSNLETSDPEDGSTADEPVKVVTLTFSGGIEGESKMTLSGPDGEVELKDIQVNENVMTATPAEPLTDGDWTVKYNVISEDGHPIEGEVKFTASNQGGKTADEEADETQTVEPDNAEDPLDNDAGDKAVDQAEKEGNTDSLQGDNDKKAESGGNTALTIGLIAAAIVLIALIAMAFRRKK